MTIPGNGTAKRIIAGVVVVVLTFMAGAVLSNSNRITAVEVEMSNLKYSIEQGRADNKDEHKEIKSMLADIAKEIRK